MTDEPRPGDATLDELASAYLDGELDTAEQARVDRDPVLSARVAELAEVRAQVAAPVVPLPADRRDAMIRAAVDAFDGPVVAPVIALADRRRGWRVLRVLGPVAAAAAAIGAVAFIARDGGGDRDTGGGVAIDASADTSAAEAEDDQASGGAAETTAAAAAEEAPAEGGEAGVEVAPAAETLSALPDLGEASTADEVAALLVATRQATLESTVPQATDEQDSGVAFAACADIGTPVATVVYAGEDALVVATGTGRYAVLGADCAIRAEFVAEP